MNLKSVMSLLLVATGVFHLVVAGIGAPEALRAPLAVFGVAYFALGVWTRGGGRAAVTVALLVTALGITAGGMTYLKDGGPATLPIMFLIDIAIIAAGVLHLAKKPVASLEK